jgi:hypothetical protein
VIQAFVCFCSTEAFMELSPIFLNSFLFQFTIVTFPKTPNNQFLLHVDIPPQFSIQFSILRKIMFPVHPNSSTKLACVSPKSTTKRKCDKHESARLQSTETHRSFSPRDFEFPAPVKHLRFDIKNLFGSLFILPFAYSNYKSSENN